VVASARGFNSAEGRGIMPGETFFISRELAKKGASWFDVKDAKLAAELEAEHQNDLKKAKKPVVADKSPGSDLA